MHLRSGHWDATDNKILVVNSNTVNLLGRDVLGNFGFTLSQMKDKRFLQNPTLTPAATWDRDKNSEFNLDIQYRPDAPPPQDTPSGELKTTDPSDSHDAPLKPAQKAEKAQATNAARLENPQITRPQQAMTTRQETAVNRDAPGPSSARTEATPTQLQQGTSTPIDNIDSAFPTAKSSNYVSPINTITRPSATPKRLI